MKETRADANKNKRKKKIFIGILITIFLGLYTAFWVAYSDVRHSANNVYKEVDKEQKRENEVTIDATEPISIALLGIDTGIYENNDGPARSDAIIVATVNPNTRTTSLVSIPRDTYALMDGYEDEVGYLYYDKLTHAFAFGGIEMALNSIQELLTIPIDYYVEVDMKGLIDIVDAIGGITVTSPLTFEYEGHKFKEGKTYELDGVEALAFARMRKTDPEGDYGRQKREKMVIKAMLDQILSLKSISRYKNILSSLEDNVHTNLTFNDMLQIYEGYRNSLENFHQDSLIVSEMYIDEIYYAYSSPEERLRVSNEIREELELDPVDVNDLFLNDLDWTYDDGFLSEQGYQYEDAQIEEWQDESQGIYGEEQDDSQDDYEPEWDYEE